MKKTFVYLAAATSAVLALWLGFAAFDVPGSKALFKQLGYWNILGLLCLALYWLIRLYGRAIVAWASRPRNLLAVGVCIACAMFLYTREKPEFKIVFDEPLLSNVARSMHLERSPVYQETAVFGFSNAETLDKRPLLFPLLVSITHDLFGYRVENSFYLNAGITFALLLLLFTLTERIAGTRTAYCATLLATASPLIGQNASGGGFELLNLVGLLAIALVAMDHWKKEDKNTLTCLLFATALFCHTRYESPLVVLPVLVIVLLVSLKSRRLPDFHWTVAILPLLFLPIAWQHRYVSVHEPFKQFSAEGDGFFSLQYMFENLGHAVNFLVMPSDRTANSPVLGIIGLASSLVVTPLFLTRFKKLGGYTSDRVPVFIIGLSIIAQFLLILTFTYGQIDDPIVSRLGLPLALYLIVCSAIALVYLAKKTNRLRYLPHVVAVLSLAYSIYQYPKIRIREASVVNDYAEWVLEHHDSLPHGNYLYISHVNRYLELYEIGNISHIRALTHPQSIDFHLSIGTFDGVFVAQAGTIDVGEDGQLSERLLPGNDIGAAYKLTPVRQKRTIPLGFVRLSKIEAVEFDPQVHQQDIDRLYSHSPLGAELIELIPAERVDEWIRSLP